MTAAEQIAELEARVLAGEALGVDEGLALLEQLGPADHEALLDAADRIRRHFVGHEVHLCSIINAKSGRCSEDCGFCAQSARFETGVDEFGLIDEEVVRGAARRARENGAEALGLVAAWRGLQQGPELERVLKLVREASDEGRVHVDASLGLIDDPAVARALADAGLHTYNHNLETARSHFGEVCESHAWEDRARTLKLVREAGMHVCSGGIMGMGETPRQRVELAAELRELDPDLVPLNFLNPVEGTPLGEQRAPLDADEALRCIAVFRFMLPRHHIMVAGGREVVLADKQRDMYRAGASATMVGDYLTTGGRSAEQDRAQLDAEGWQPRVQPVAADAPAERPATRSPRPGAGRASDVAGAS